MLKKILFVFVLTFFCAVSAQTTLIDATGDGGFENGATFIANGWTENSGPNIPNFPFNTWSRWTINTGATSPTGVSAYLSNDISVPIPIYTYGGVGQDPNGPKIYRDISFPAGEEDITLNFDWRGDGDANDYLRVWLVPGGTPIGFAGITTTAPVGSVQIGIDFNGQATWTNETITIPTTYAGTTAQLVFEWRNVGASGATPAAIDNISLISDIGAATYCAPTSNSSDDWIDDFTTNAGGPSDINNLGSGYTAPGYEDFSVTQSVEQFAGGIVNFEVVYGHSGTPFAFGFNIWVDFNANGVFTDAGEKVYASGGTVLGGINDDFSIPLGTPTGNYRMRIRAQFANGDPDSCGVIGFGEAEDYTLTVSDISCTDDPSTITITTIGFTDATISWTAAASVIGYEYFITTNTNIPFYNQIPTGTTTSPITTANLAGLTDGTTYYVWVRSICDTSFGGTGNWIGSETFTTLVSPPTTTNVSICPGDPSQDLTAVSSDCAASTNLGTQLNGTLNAGTDSVALQPDLPILGGGSSATCAFKGVTSNYEAIDFSVDVTGSYTFTMVEPTPDFDAMGYIVVNDGNFTPGSCASGTWLLGDDDSGPGLEPQLVVNLTVGVSYTLITTKYGSGDTTHTGPYTWNLTGPGSLLGPASGSMDWYTAAIGGTPIFSGINFDPVVDGTIPLGDTNTTGVYTYWASCASSPGIRTQADFIIGKVWNGSTDTNWETPANWTPNGVPTDTECVVIENLGFSPIIASGTNAEGFRLIVENGATLTQNSNSTLTVTDAITVNAGGTYNMLDSASLIQENDVPNTVNGTFTMDRTVSMRRSDYVYWSSPVTAFNVEDVSINTPNGYKYEWLPTLAGRPIGPPPDFVPNDYGIWQSANAGVMEVGKGYAIKGPTGHTTTASDFTATFMGTPNNGTITQTITRGTYTGPNYTYQPNPGGNNLLVTNDDDNWNFIGNPFPSSLDVFEFLFLPANTHFNGSVYLWTHGTALGTANTDPFYEDFVYNYNAADYLVYNAAGPSTQSGFDGKIASGQGFFVLMQEVILPVPTPNPATATFDNSMRDNTFRNDQFYRSANDSEEDTENNKHRIWLEYITPNGVNNTTLVAYVNGATNDKDRMYDAKTTKGVGLNLYSMLNDESYIIQGRQTPFVDSDLVPIGLNITEAGAQTIAINGLEGLFMDTDQDIYIEDLVAGVTHNLKNAPYTFTSDAGIINDRLVLRYTANSLSVEDFDTLNGIKVFEENEEIIVNSQYESIQSIEVYDVLGRNLFTDTSINSNRFAINAISPNNTALFLKIKLVNGHQKITKIIF